MRKFQPQTRIVASVLLLTGMMLGSGRGCLGNEERLRRAQRGDTVIQVITEGAYSSKPNDLVPPAGDRV